MNLVLQGLQLAATAQNPTLNTIETFASVHNISKQKTQLLKIAKNWQQQHFLSTPDRKLQSTLYKC